MRACRWGMPFCIPCPTAAAGVAGRPPRVERRRPGSDRPGGRHAAGLLHLLLGKWRRKSALRQCIDERPSFRPCPAKSYSQQQTFERTPRTRNTARRCCADGGQTHGRRAADGRRSARSWSRCATTTWPKTSAARAWSSRPIWRPTSTAASTAVPLGLEAAGQPAVVSLKLSNVYDGVRANWGWSGPPAASGPRRLARRWINCGPARADHHYARPRFPLREAAPNEPLLVGGERPREPNISANQGSRDAPSSHAVHAPLVCRCVCAAIFVLNSTLSSPLSSSGLGATTAGHCAVGQVTCMGQSSCRAGEAAGIKPIIGATVIVDGSALCSMSRTQPAMQTFAICCRQHSP